MKAGKPHIKKKTEFCREIQRLLLNGHSGSELVVVSQRLKFENNTNNYRIQLFTNMPLFGKSQKSPAELVKVG